MSERYFDITVKLIIVGDISVGKTSLLNSFKDEEDPTNTIATIGTEYYSFIQEFKQKNLKVNIWDTSGQERYRSITTQYFKGANGVVLVYDVTKRESFVNMQKWMDEIHQKAKEDVMIIILGNKIDQTEQRQVSIEEAKEFSDQHHTLFMETSALFCYRNDVKKAFQTLIDILAD